MPAACDCHLTSSQTSSVLPAYSHCTPTGHAFDSLVTHAREDNSLCIEPVTLLSGCGLLPLSSRLWVWFLAAPAAFWWGQHFGACWRTPGCQNDCKVFCCNTSHNSAVSLRHYTESVNQSTSIYSGSVVAYEGDLGSWLPNAERAAHWSALITGNRKLSKCQTRHDNI